MFKEYISLAFLDNKYTKYYINIIERSTNRVKLNRNDPNYIYYEAHHILPRCIYPQFSNLRKNKWNKALLTAKEHFICHLLLTKMVSHDSPFYVHLMHALNAFCMARNEYRILTAKQFEIARIKSSEAKSILYKGKRQSESTKRKRSQSLTGKKRTAETKKLLSLQKMGDNNPMKNPETAKKVSDALRGRKRQPLSPETRHKISVTLKQSEKMKAHINKISAMKRGKSVPNEVRQKISNTLKERNAKYGSLGHTVETKERLSEMKKGGFWITNGTSIKYIKNEHDIPEGWRKGRK